jgi:hypothetical protein
MITLLIEIARAAGLEEDVLPENVPMLKVIERCGLPITTRRKRATIHVTLAFARNPKR